MLYIPMTSSYKECPASYWRLTVSQDDRGGAAGKTEVVGQIAWCSAIQALVNQCRQLESDALSHRQPMK